MSHPYPKGSIIVNGEAKRKVLEELGDLRFVTVDARFGGNWKNTPASCPYHIKELDHRGWKVEEPKAEEWTPELGGVYWYIGGQYVEGCDFAYWLGYDHTYLNRKSGLGIYRTQAEAQAVFEKLKKFLKGE